MRLVVVTRFEAGGALCSRDSSHNWLVYHCVMVFFLLRSVAWQIGSSSVIVYFRVT